MTLDEARTVCAELVADGSCDSSDEAAEELLARHEIDETVYDDLLSANAWRLYMGLVPA